MRYLVTILTLISIQMGWSQKSDFENTMYSHPDYQVFNVGLNGSEDVKKLKEYISSIPELKYLEELTKDQIWHTVYCHKSNSEKIIQQVGDKMPKFIKHFQSDQRAQSRCGRPNDNLYYKQYYLWQLGIEESWCDGVSSTTVAGDTIVIAVIEAENTIINHDDINANVYVNHEEIPNDMIDNDGNGYVDDYHGLNALNRTGSSMENGTAVHGLGVSGVIAAEYNNNRGLAGISGAVKIMHVNNARSTALSARGLDYIYQQRKLYNDSNGEEGEYIVAVNSSYGIDTAFPQENVAWCEAFDKLASVGIISIAATRNDSVNIDMEGDVPGLCPSDGLITATGLNRDGSFAPRAYSKNSVDIACYSEDIELLSQNNEYYEDSGTSYSAPMVAGLVGLIYGQACEKFVELSKNQPRQAAAEMRDFILNLALTTDELKSLTVTGGRLNPEGSKLLLDFYCERPQDADLAIEFVSPSSSETEILLKYVPHSSSPMQYEIYNILGQKVASDAFSIELIGTRIEKLSIPPLSMGVYYFILKQDGQMKSQAFGITDKS